MPPKWISKKRTYRKYARKGRSYQSRTRASTFAPNKYYPNRSGGSSGRTELKSVWSEGLPDRLRVKLTYSEATGFSGLGPLGAIYRANGPFDPRVAVGGGQPNYYDQWSALYNNVTVLACKAKCYFINNSSTVPCEITTGWTDTDPTGFNYDRLSMLRYANVRKQLQQNTGGNGTAQTIDYITMAKLNGRRNNQAVLDRDDMGSTTGTLPADQLYFFWAIQSSDNGGSSALGFARISLTYYVEFNGPVTIDPS